MSPFEPNPEIRITAGGLLRRAFDLLAACWPFALSLGVTAGAANVLLQLINPGWWMLREQATGADVPDLLYLDMGMGLVVFWGTWLALMALLWGALQHGLLEVAHGRTARLATSLRAGVRFFLPYALVLVLLGLAIGAGLVLCIVPGLIAAAASCVALPALIEERKRPFAAIERSVRLSEGHRFTLFAGLAALWLLQLVIGFAGGFLSGFWSETGTGVASWTATQVVTQFLGGLLWTFLLAFQVTAYHDLRMFSEGFRDDAVAAVFD